MWGKRFVGFCLSHEDRERNKDEEVDVQELRICEVRANRVEQGNCSELDHGIELDELKTLEGSRESTATLSQ